MRRQFLYLILSALLTVVRNIATDTQHRPYYGNTEDTQWRWCEWKGKAAKMFPQKQFSAFEFGFLCLAVMCLPHYCSVRTASSVSAASGSKSHQPPPPPMSGLHGGSIILPSDRFNAIHHTFTTQSWSTKDQQVHQYSDFRWMLWCDTSKCCSVLENLGHRFMSSNWMLNLQNWIYLCQRQDSGKMQLERIERQAWLTNVVLG